jgi:predicted glycosyltransferase
MRICISINDTAQAHFWKHIIRSLQDHGHRVIVLTRDTGETADLLKEMGIPFHPASTDPGSGFQRYLLFPYQVFQMYRYLKDKQIDIIAGFGGYNALAGLLLRKPNISFQDSEPGVYATLYSLIYRALLAFEKALITPSCFTEDLGGRHIKIDSYKEIAYLHPKYFRPDEGIFSLLGLSPGESYFLLRFSAFNASHDARITGFSPDHKIALVKELEKYGKVFISAEASVPDEIKDRMLRIPKHRIHDVIYYARFLVTDTSTMATEAAVLGTPAIRTVSIANNDFGIMGELENKYGLLQNFARTEDAIEQAKALARSGDMRATWSARRDRLLRDKIDLARFMVWFIENYPVSAWEVRKDPGIQRIFKVPVPSSTGA